MWARKWQWRKRIAEWDRFLDKKKRQKAVAAVEQMKDRHIALAEDLQVLGAKELKKWIERAKVDKKIQVTVADLLRAVEAGVKLERLSRGEPETVAEERRVNDAEQTQNALRDIIENEEAMEAMDVVIGAVEKKEEADEDVN
jgi:hypothetical protein